MKQKLIASILDASKIHHNISTLGMKLPDAPKGVPDDIFWDTCGQLIEMFIEDWESDPRNDSGNRNLCGCNATKEGEKRLPDNSNIKKPENILPSGACKKHDLWHVYQYGRMGATLYWDKYWNESNSRGIFFKYEEDELKEKDISELKTIYSDICTFTTSVAGLLKSLPSELKYRYAEWEKENKAEKRHEALGYNKTLGSLLEDENPQIVRLAKGIKKEINK